ncbi:MAG: TlpA family protein disulfide reductase [Planctomycetes bacterium]|nr:TlpA family protein disulfide reductase [Planctomycetota bacterium]
MSTLHTVRLLLLAACALCAPTVTVAAQTNLAELQKRFADEQRALREEKQGALTFDDVRALAERHADQLHRWLASDAKGTDLINGRLLLTNIYLDIGREDDARTTLRSIDVDAAPAMELATAAEMATWLGMTEERSAWIDRAVAKPSAFEERMALGIFLATRLDEPARAEALFTQAERDAKDDEARARVGWFRAAMVREREDLEDGSYEKALKELSERYPATYWGGVARDRLRALDLRVGAEAIPFDARTLDGSRVSLESLRGKVVLLDFWSSRVHAGRDTTPLLKELDHAWRDRGLAILGVCFDDDRDVARSAAAASGRTWPQIFDGRGWQNDVALRYAIEQVPDHVLIGRDGRIAAIRVYLQDDEGIEELREAVARAVEQQD